MLIPPFSFSPNSQVEEDTCSCPHGFQHSSSFFFFCSIPFLLFPRFPNPRALLPRDHLPSPAPGPGLGLMRVGRGCPQDKCYRGNVS